MFMVNNAVARTVGGNYARVNEHTGRTVRNNIEYRVVGRGVPVQRPVVVDNTTNVTIENQFEMYI